MNINSEEHERNKYDDVVSSLHVIVADLTKLVTECKNKEDKSKLTKRITETIRVLQNEVNVQNHPFSSDHATGLDQETVLRCRTKWRVLDGFSETLCKHLMSLRIQDFTSPWYGYVCFEIKNRETDPHLEETDTLLAILRALATPREALKRGGDPDAVDQRPGLVKLREAIGFNHHQYKNITVVSGGTGYEVGDTFTIDEAPSTSPSAS